MLSNKKAREVLEKISKLIISDTGFYPVVATEIEFYLSYPDEKILEDLFSEISKELRKKKIYAGSIERERGKDQFEVALMPNPNVVLAAENTEKTKKIISKLANDYQAEAIFDPKPYEEQPGNGLHIHISLMQKDGLNVLPKSDDGEESDIMRHGIGGMLSTMRESMIFFAPHEESYKRFSEKVFNKASETYNHAPTHISWGGNNRTVAIRIPASTINPTNRHIEHRVAAPDADSHLVIAAVLAGLHYGIKNKIEPMPKIWGNAYDKQYGLEKLPTNIKESKEAFENSKIIKEYLTL